MKVYISGADSGPNPAPGLGTARSLRKVYPDITLVAVAYSQQASGIHSHIFDDVLMFRPWEELDLSAHARQIESHLTDDSYWLPGIDTEIGLLVDEIGCNNSILGPSPRAYQITRKPNIKAAKKLPVSVPQTMPAYTEDSKLEHFCHSNDWEVWVKGPHYKAKAASSWDDIVSARKKLSTEYDPTEIFVQSHVSGEEFSIAFVATDGYLHHAVQVEKRIQTEEGNTWAGKTCQVSDDLYTALESVISEIGWTGGGELELIRDENNHLHLIEWNPRFPAWIHGATITGRNLPAKLLEEFREDGQDISKLNNSIVGGSFTRTVQECSTRNEYPLIDQDQTDQFDNSQTGKIESEERTDSSSPKRGIKRQPEPLKSIEHRDLQRLQLNHVQTPERVSLSESTEDAFDTGKRLKNVAGVDSDLVEIAYSVKTNPSRRLLNQAHDRGFMAEVISGEELNWVSTVGFDANSIVVNGPMGVYDLLESEVGPVNTVFADSIQSLEALVDTEKPPADTIGIRIQYPGEGSRFGIPIKKYRMFSEFLNLLRQLPNDTPFGIHMHIQSSQIGSQNWQELVNGLIDIAQVIDNKTGCQIKTLDFGGGWTPLEFQQEFEDQLASLCHRVENALPDVERIILEPGKALARKSACILTEVVEVRKYSYNKHIVVDTAVSDLPRTTDRPHPVAIPMNGEWQRLKQGGDKILGRVCLENDVIASGLHVPESVEAGDRLAILDAGAYNASMSYSFGQGE